MVIYHCTYEQVVLYTFDTLQCELFVRGTIGGALLCNRNKRHPRKSFFHERSLLYKFRWMPIIVLIWVLYFILHEYSPRACKKHLRGKINSKVLLRIYNDALGRIQMDVTTDMIGNQLGNFVELDETWLCSGNKDFRGRHVVRKNSMVHTSETCFLVQILCIVLYLCFSSKYTIL